VRSREREMLQAISVKIAQFNPNVLGLSCTIPKAATSFSLKGHPNESWKPNLVSD
jgi:hypothetical protein